MGSCGRWQSVPHAQTNTVWQLPFGKTSGCFSPTSLIFLTVFITAWVTASGFYQTSIVYLCSVQSHLRWQAIYWEALPLHTLFPSHHSFTPLLLRSLDHHNELILKLTCYLAFSHESSCISHWVWQSCLELRGTIIPDVSRTKKTPKYKKKKSAHCGSNIVSCLSAGQTLRLSSPNTKMVRCCSSMSSSCWIRLKDLPWESSAQLSMQRKGREALLCTPEQPKADVKGAEVLIPYL